MLLTVSSLPRGFLPGPTKCEVEQFTATNFGHPYIPSCHRDGAYQAVQCQREGPCWCVDAQGREVRGTRRPDASLPCGGSPARASCLGLLRSLYCVSPNPSRQDPFIQIPHRPVKLNMMKTHLPSLTSNMFLVPCLA